mmetsp:Transcript_61548/g.115094  ORF Transcript_61548/g.115094 Transcript_61548/m.115094 type:complete len:170 (-) Transcript_61548:152-661(-)
MSFDRGSASQVVPTQRSERINDSGLKWQCDCGNLNASHCSHCTKCSLLRKEERELRQVQRSGLGLGRGGGFFEREESGSKSRDNADLSQAKGGLDIYGRRRTDPRDDRKPSADKVAAAASKEDRQKLALERLHHRKKLSPPRPSHFREKSSRSRSLERRREARRIFNYG